MTGTSLAPGGKTGLSEEENGEEETARPSGGGWETAEHEGLSELTPGGVRVCLGAGGKGGEAYTKTFPLPGLECR